MSARQRAADPVELEPGTPEWAREMTASKVAAVLGLSPWESRFSLWYRMAGELGADPESKVQSRGHFLEPAVAAWLADQHGFTLRPGLCWRNRARPWQVASPDRLVDTPGSRRSLSDPARYGAVVEVKTAAESEPWGPDGSDIIPPYYRAQVVWQCDTLGLPKGYVGVLLPRLEFRGYVITPEDGEAEWIREEVRSFLDTLVDGEPPDVDAHGATYRTLRVIHPDIEPRDVPVPDELAYAYAASVVGLRDAKVRAQYEQNRMALALGGSKRAVLDRPDDAKPTVVAQRQPAPQTGVPYVAATRSKRTLADLAALYDPATAPAVPEPPEEDL